MVSRDRNINLEIWNRQLEIVSETRLLGVKFQNGMTRWKPSLMLLMEVLRILCKLRQAPREQTSTCARDLQTRLTASIWHWLCDPTILHQVTYRREMKCTYYSIKIRSQTLCVVGVLRIRVLEPFFRFFFIFKGGLFWLAGLFMAWIIVVKPSKKWNLLPQVLICLEKIFQW